jgi:diadenosine tetraphosphate (Ap4A) HIT family hydrolase
LISVDSSPEYFSLHPRLREDTLELGRFRLSRVLLMNDSRYPWCILVPERPDVSEIYQLDEPDQVTLALESATLAERMAQTFQADKMNVAMLGNLVPQLHIHHVVRFRTDPVWPGPVWGAGAAIPYGAAELDEIADRLRRVLGERLLRV